MFYYISPLNHIYYYNILDICLQNKHMRIFSIILFTLVTSFTNAQKTINENREFYKEYINAVKSNFIHKDKIDWDKFERIVFEKAEISKDSAIESSLKLLNEYHTSYHTKEDEYIFSKEKSYFELGDSIAINYIGPFYTSTKDEASEYINRVQKRIQDNLKKKPKYWIIDLRSNTGGNMWPMLSALLPFYEEGNIGYFETSEKSIPWSKKEGYIYQGNSNMSRLFTDKQITYRIKPKYIFVLISERTSSSGEAIAISLKSLNNTIFIGSQTGGFASGNATIPLSNGDELYITSNYMVDIHKNRHIPLYPDYMACTVDEMERIIINYIKEN